MAKKTTKKNGTAKNGRKKVMGSGRKSTAMKAVMKKNAEMKKKQRRADVEKKLPMKGMKKKTTREKRMKKQIGQKKAMGSARSGRQSTAAMKTTMKRTAMKKTTTMKKTVKKQKSPTVGLKKNKTTRGLRMKKQVFDGKKKKTVGGLQKNDLIENKRGKIVSKKKSEKMKESNWVKSVTAAREQLGIEGFQLIGGPKEVHKSGESRKKSWKLLKKAREFLKIYKEEEQQHPCLTKDETKKIRLLLKKKRENPKILELKPGTTKHGYEITEKQLGSLDDKEWLSTKVFDAYLDLTDSLASTTEDERLVLGVGQWLKIEENFIKKKKTWKERMDNYFDYGLVILPVFSNDDHFCLFCIYPQQRGFIWYDPKGDVVPKDYSRLLTSHLSSMEKAKRHNQETIELAYAHLEQTPGMENIRQGNDDDCGPLVALVARNLICNPEINMSMTDFPSGSEEDVKNFRIYMAHELIAHGTLCDNTNLNVPAIDVRPDDNGEEAALQPDGGQGRRGRRTSLGSKSNKRRGRRNSLGSKSNKSRGRRTSLGSKSNKSVKMIDLISESAASEKAASESDGSQGNSQ